MARKTRCPDCQESSTGRCEKHRGDALVLKLTSQRAVSDLPALPAGRTYLVMGPYCWGKDPDPAAAVKKARSNSPRWLGAPAWQFMVFDAPADAQVDDMGYIRWKDGRQKCPQVAAFNMPEAN